MALLNRNTDMEVPPPKTAPELRQQTNLRWLHLIGFAVAAVFIAFLVVLGGKWVYDSVSNNNPKQVSVTPQSTTKQQAAISPNEESSGSSAPSTNSSTGQNPSSSSGSNSSSTSQGSSGSTQSGSTNNNLPNNGPGDVAKLFLETSLAAAVLHYLNRRRKAAKTN